MNSYYSDGTNIIAHPSDPNTFYSSGWIYSSSYYMGFGKSTDGGTNWTHSTISGANGYPYGMAIDEARPDTVFICGYEGSTGAIYRSTNAGATWSKLSASGLTATTYAIAVRSDNPNVVFAATSSGIYRSTDGGTSFTKVSSVINYCKDVMIDPDNPGTVWVGTYNQGVYRSTDGGNTWTAVNTGLGDMCVNKLALNPGQWLFAGTDGAAAYRWSLATGTPEDETQPIEQAELFAAPNPSSGGTAIFYRLAESGPVTISIYDLQGRLVRTISEGVQTPGSHETWWNASEDSGEPVPPGVYFMRLDAAGGVLTGRLVITN
ncbi:T9SS type A sorting domain-containing protein [Candidatus Fermentibacteria bacterium]|nr:T9SS type A sorting domain-containing protein [Candidatus Fermentibacteria bacterium]